MPRSGCSALHGVNPNLKKNQIFILIISNSKYNHLQSVILVMPQVLGVELKPIDERMTSLQERKIGQLEIRVPGK